HSTQIERPRPLGGLSPLTLAQGSTGEPAPASSSQVSKARYERPRTHSMPFRIRRCHSYRAIPDFRSSHRSSGYISDLLVAVASAERVNTVLTRRKCGHRGGFCCYRSPSRRLPWRQNKHAARAATPWRVYSPV